MVMKPDPKIKAQMVLFNWIKHRKGLSNKKIAEMLGHSYPSTVSYCNVSLKKVYKLEKHG